MAWASILSLLLAGACGLLFLDPSEPLGSRAAGVATGVTIMAAVLAIIFFLSSLAHGNRVETLLRALKDATENAKAAAEQSKGASKLAEKAAEEANRAAVDARSMAKSSKEAAEDTRDLLVEHAHRQGRALERNPELTMAAITGGVNLSASEPDPDVSQDPIGEMDIRGEIYLLYAPSAVPLRVLADLVRAWRLNQEDKDSSKWTVGDVTYLARRKPGIASDTQKGNRPFLVGFGSLGPSEQIGEVWSAYYGGATPGGVTVRCLLPFVEEPIVLSRYEAST